MDQQGQNGLLATFREPWRTRGAVAYGVAAVLIGFYTLMYFRDHLGIEGSALDPETWASAVGLRSRWLFYGALYSVAMVGGAIYYLRRHGNSRYNRIRIAVNVVVQVVLAFTLPLVMPYFFTGDPNQFWKYEYYFSYFWPLDWYKLHPGSLQNIPVVLAIYSIVGALVAAPLLAYFFGKRWYCSWICGCGGLANTFGDPWRHLTSSSTASWRFEKRAIHTVMFVAILSTFLLFLDHLVGGRYATFHRLVDGGQWWSMKSLYGYVVGAILAGVIGTGLYPLLGPRVWCRNFCPMAALLGLFQKLGRFRIAVKPGMCISCGNCTTYCEMGIDVRSYAQNDESFTRAACVGCGMCAHVCPRGVLKLENAPRLNADKKRVGLPIVDL
ncbi:MAG: 4Fe-4S binding protein [Myxococcota bacterium]|jgi:NAD-dependent dihydropyrimidine dehydrogenase PreA subunit|nr:4Fe-4S binding protein [Myxococcota bacterium]